MARRPREDDNEISLFPFLSIIASVIGVLTMLIATLTLSQTRASGVADDLKKAESHEKTVKDLTDTEERIAALKAKISVSKSATLRLREEQKEIVGTKEELERLFAELERIRKEIEQQKKIQIVIPEINPADRETAADMQQQYDQLAEQIAQLEKDLQARKDVPTEGNVTVLPQGSGLNFNPYFVECASDSIVLHHMPEPKRVRRNDVVKDKDFLALLNKVANGTNDSVVFLLRSDALATYRMCRGICVKQDVRNGKIPVVGKGRIDLSAFGKKKKR